MANPPITIGPFTSVPAPGSPIRSDWTQQISTYVAKAPAGYHFRHIFPSASAGWSTTEAVMTTWAMPAANPAGATRVVSIRYGLCVIPTAAPAPPSALLSVTVRAGTTVAGAAAGANQHNFQSGDRGFDGRPNVFGEFAASAYPAGATYCITFLASAGTYTLGASTWIYVEDVRSSI